MCEISDLASDGTRVDDMDSCAGVRVAGELGWTWDGIPSYHLLGNKIFVAIQQSQNEEQ